MPNNPRPRCILFDKPDRDLYNANTFGDVVELFEANCNRPSIYDCAELNRSLMEKLDGIDYDPDSDYIILLGGLVPVASLCATIANNYGEFKVLLFDAIPRRYYEGVIGQLIEENTVA